MFGFDRRRAHPDTDLGRAQRMRMMLLDLEAEVETETRDIQLRYRHAVDDAAFALQALEDGEGGGLRKVDMVSRAVEHCSRNAGRLQLQLAFLRDLRQQLDAFVIGRRR
jgi:hypothetical protein